MTKRHLTKADTVSVLYLSKGYFGMTWFYAVFAISFTGMPVIGVVSLALTNQIRVDVIMFLSIFLIIGLVFCGVIIKTFIFRFKIQLVLTDKEVMVPSHGTYTCFYYNEVNNYHIRNESYQSNGKSIICAYGKVIFEVNGEMIKALARNLATVKKILEQKNVSQLAEEDFEDEEDDVIDYSYRPHKIEQVQSYLSVDTKQRCKHCGGIKPPNHHSRKCIYCGRKM